MKAALALSALFASVMADPFQLIISKASGKVQELRGSPINFQSGGLLVGGQGRHGVNFNGADGTLSIQNGDPIYVAKDGRVRIKEYNQPIPADGLTEGFTTASGNTLKWAQGEIVVCRTKVEFEWGPPSEAWGLFAERPGAQLPGGCVQVTLKKTAV